MRKLIASVQMSLDGFIAGPNGEMDWILDGKEISHPPIPNCQEQTSFYEIP